MLLAWAEKAYENYATCEFSAVYLKSSDCNGRRKLEECEWEKQLLPPSYAFKWFSIQPVVNSENFFFVKSFPLRI